MANFRNKEKAKILLTTFIVIFILLAIMKVFALQAEQLEKKKIYSNYWRKVRLEKSLEYLPDMLNRSNKPILMLGSSEIEFAIKYDRLQGQLQECEAEAFSFSHRGHYAFYSSLNQRLLEEIHGANKKIEQLFVFIPMLRLTRQGKQRSDREAHRATFYAAIYSPRMLYELWFQNPQEALTLAISKYFLGSMRPSSYASLRNQRELGADSIQKFYREKGYLDPEFWSQSRHGFSGWGEFLSRQSYSRLVRGYASQRAQREVFNYFEDCCSITENKIDFEAVENFLDSHQVLLQASKEIVFVSIPYRKNITLSEQALSNWNELLNRIRGRPGFKVLDAREHISFSQEDHIDVIHLSDRGAIKLSELLAQVVCKKVELK